MRARTASLPSDQSLPLLFAVLLVAQATSSIANNRGSD